ncbi:MAG TPA: hypothetical protein VHO70_02365 [Chitinispirillaceae bacterium]|nr:hypothetical protein [Chitinispirillaceae bacterium]
MKKTALYSTKILSILSLCIFIISCGEDEPQTWVGCYSSITLGAQDNYSIGHFFKPQTGEVVAVENTAGQEKYLGLMFFTESDGTNSWLTFPADGASAAVFSADKNRLFIQTPGGTSTWPAASIVSGMINKCSLTSVEFDNLMSTATWGNFDKVFKTNNNNKEYLEYKKNYVLTPESGDVYLAQFNGIVRAIICVKTVVKTGSNGGSITYDIIVEGKDAYSNSSSAKYLQPIQSNQ